jgi:outer membrane protein
LGAGVFARYYFLELGQRFKTYSEFGIAFSSGKRELSTTENAVLLEDFETSGIGTGLSLGMQYFVTQKLAINFGLSNVLSFSSVKETNNLSAVTNERKTSNFSGNLNVFNNFFNTL